MPLDFMLKNFIRGFSVPDHLRFTGWTQSLAPGMLAEIMQDFRENESTIRETESFLEKIYKSICLQLKNDCR